MILDDTDLSSIERDIKSSSSSSILNKEKSFNLTYNFSSREIALLAKFLRQNQDIMPQGLEAFYKALEETVYKNLSIDEAGIFYS